MQSAAVPESSAAPKTINARKSAHVEFSATRERVGGNEIGRCSARQAQAAVIAGETPFAPIPFTDIGAKATADYHGNAIGIDPRRRGRARAHFISETIRLDLRGGRRRPRGAIARRRRRHRGGGGPAERAAGPGPGVSTARC